MRRIILIAAGIVAGLPVGASAAEPNWLAVAGNESFTEFLDTNSLAIRAGRLTALTMTNFMEPQQRSGRQVFLSAKTLGMYDCESDRSGAIDMTLYSSESGRGDVVTSEAVMPAAIRLQNPEPGSVENKKLRAVCSIWAGSHPAARYTQKQRPAARLTASQTS